MKSIIIHTLNDDGTERIQKIQKEQTGEKLVEILYEEVGKEKNTFVIFKGDSNGNIDGKICGAAPSLITCAAKIIESIHEETGVSNNALLNIVLDELEG